MKTQLRSRSVFALGAALAGAVSILTVLAQSVPQPVLKISPTGTNQILINITNGVTYTNYQVYWTADLADPTGFPWVLSALGTKGQSNFVISTAPAQNGFFRALVGSDQDGDGIPDWMDANPNDPTIGVLKITIDSPTNGMIFN